MEHDAAVESSQSYFRLLDLPEQLCDDIIAECDEATLYVLLTVCRPLYRLARSVLYRDRLRPTRQDVGDSRRLSDPVSVSLLV